MQRPIAFPPPLPFRACDLCDHGITVGGIRHCVCTNVVITERLPSGVPVHVARSPTGACGLDARHMSAPFLQVA